MLQPASATGSGSLFLFPDFSCFIRVLENIRYNRKALDVFKSFCPSCMEADVYHLKHVGLINDISSKTSDSTSNS